MVVFLSKKFRSLLSVFKKKAGLKPDEQRKLIVHYTASQHYQENVFIEGSRSKYLEDLHTEAQEGLKIQQQEEHNNGVDFKDDQSVSTVSPEEKDVSQERDGYSGCESNAEHSITSVSSRSAVSLRPVLTRQGSTFKPLNTVKRPDKAKKRTRRTTIMGIPQQVQRELCMGRVLLQQLPNGKDDHLPGTVIIPTIDGVEPIPNVEGARVHLYDVEALQESRHEQFLRHHIQSVYRDDLLLNCKLGRQALPMQRPKSLAVPGMTTTFSFLQEPQGPVMSISPQATYLSTIIPNAVLPAAIDVIEIDRSHSRRSLRTVSKSSLASASPGSSRSGGGNHAPPSNSSKQSHSQSSETIISQSSTISLRGKAPLPHVTDSMMEVTDLNHEEQVSLKSSSSWLSSSTKEASNKTEQGEQSDAENVQNGQVFSRSLSVMKAKLPPAPPRRTYSLHQEKIKQKEHAGTKDLNNLESSSGQMNGDGSAKEGYTSSKNGQISRNSPVTAYLADSHSSLTVSPDSPEQDFTDAQNVSGNSSPQSKFERTLSPSSGYSSQSCTPTHSSKDICPSSPLKHKVKPPKPERLGARTSPVVSVSSSMNSLSSPQTHTPQSQPPTVSPAVTTVKNKVTPSLSASALKEFFDIPPPPKVKAPCPPPPETWAHNKRTVELLFGQTKCPNRIFELQKHQKDPLLVKDQAITDTTDQDGRISEEIKKTDPYMEDKNVTTNAKNESIPLQKQATLEKDLALSHKENPLTYEKEEESHPERKTASCMIEKQEQQHFGTVKKEQESAKDSEKVLSDKVDQREVSTTQHLKSEKYQFNGSALLETITLTTKTEGSDTEDKYFASSTENEALVHTPKENRGVVISRVIANSPPPSPPPAHHPPPPPSKKSAGPTLSSPLTEEELQPDKQKQYSALECSWPPPPPPMEETADLFEGQDEVDFPPPPPPFMHEPPSNMLNLCNVESTGQVDNITPEDSCMPNKANHSEVTSELQILSSTTPLQTINKEPPVDVTLNVEEVSDNKSFDQSHVNSKSCEVSLDGVCAEIPFLPEISSQPQDVTLQLMPEENPPQAQEDPPSPATMPAHDLSKHVQSAVAPLNADVTSELSSSTEDQSTVNFKRQPSLTSKDSKSKELSSKHKNVPISKEDANIPLVTPSLLQMVRLRSVNVEDQDQLSQNGKSEMEATPNQDQGISSQVIPQKPIRKSCLKSTQPSVRSSPAMVLNPSMRLQEAIRMKTAAMSSSGAPPRLSLRIPATTTNSNDNPAHYHKTHESCDMYKSPASTASFIFSKSPKKVIIETPTSPEVQGTLKQNLAAELMQISEQSKSVITNVTKKHVPSVAKVPPPVAKKPAHATNSCDKIRAATALTLESSSTAKPNGAENGQTETLQPAGQQAQSPGSTMPASTTETASILQVS